MFISNFLGSFLLFFDNILDSGIIKFPKYICMIFIFCLLTLLIGEKSYSVEDCVPQNFKPNVLVTVIFIDETKVCTLNGKASSYGNLNENKKDNSGKERNCDKLNYDQLKDLKLIGHTVTDQEPIDTINLQELFRLVKLYSLKCPLKKPCMKPKDRSSIILAFEFQMDEPKGADISLERQIPPNMKEYFKAPYYGYYSTDGKLDEGGHWINHQRADLFLPGHGVEWILKANQYCWKLITEE